MGPALECGWDSQRQSIGESCFFQLPEGIEYKDPMSSSPFSTKTLSCLNPCSICACSHNLCEFIWHPSCYAGKTVSLESSITSSSFKKTPEPRGEGWGPIQSPSLSAHCPVVDLCANGQDQSGVGLRDCACCLAPHLPVFWFLHSFCPFSVMFHEP